MRCPACKFEDTKVLDSRSLEEGAIIRRRRECLKCGFRFSTHEEMEVLNLVVIKKNGSRELYQREKLETGIRKALEKRPVKEEKIKKTIHEIEKNILAHGKGEIESKKIGELVMLALKELDDVAYIRFASVYKSFQDMETFQKEIKKINNIKS